jgi:hypothetical protein
MSVVIRRIAHEQLTVPRLPEEAGRYLLLWPHTFLLNESFEA